MGTVSIKRMLCVLFSVILVLGLVPGTMYAYAQPVSDEDSGSLTLTTNDYNVAITDVDGECEGDWSLTAKDSDSDSFISAVLSDAFKNFGGNKDESFLFSVSYNDKQGTDISDNSCGSVTLKVDYTATEYTVLGLGSDGEWTEVKDADTSTNDNGDQTSLTFTTDSPTDFLLVTANNETEADDEVAAEGEATSEERDSATSVDDPEAINDENYGIMPLKTDIGDLPSSVTVLSDDTALPNTDEMISFDFSKMEVEWGDAYDPDKGGLGKVTEATNLQDPETSSSGDTSIAYSLPIEDMAEEHNYSDVVTFKEPDVASIDGKSIDFELSVDQIHRGKIASAYQDRDYSEYSDFIFLYLYGGSDFVFSQHDFIYADGTVHAAQIVGLDECTVTYTAKFSWHDTGEAIDVPFYMLLEDLDVNRAGVDASEGWTANSGFDKFYVYESYELNITEDSDGITFASALPDDTNLTGDDSIRKAGLVAITQNGAWTSTVRQSPGCMNKLIAFSDYLNLDTPAKEVTSTGSNADGTYAPGDTVEYAVTQQMLEYYVNCYSTFTSLEFKDILPQGLTYVANSAEMYIDDTLAGSDIGSASYDASTRTLTYTFNTDWLDNEDNYTGQEFKLVLKATVDEDATTDTYTNKAYTYYSGLEYGPAEVDIDVNSPKLSIVKTADQETYYVGDDVTYTIDVTQTVEGLVAENVVITDTLPSEVELVDVALEGVDGTVSTDGNSFTVTCPTLAYGETASLTVSATAKTPGTGIVNTATADADNADPVDDDATISIIDTNGGNPNTNGNNPDTNGGNPNTNGNNPDTNGGGSGTNDSGTGSPKTGDTTPFVALVVVALVAAGVATTAGVRAYRNRHHGSHLS